MDYLQYIFLTLVKVSVTTFSFKPYYKWITFNTEIADGTYIDFEFCFKPYYKWITFNTKRTY